MTAHKPVLIVTGASGFVGRHFLASVCNDCTIYALARRSQFEAGVPQNKNIKWLLVDVANDEQLDRVISFIQSESTVDFIFHFAGYYNFSYDDNPEYERTNVGGTSLILKYADNCNVKRFIFASSIAACEFPSEGNALTESSPPDANHIYAESKKKGEELTLEYSSKFPCSVVRFAALFSDWGEYGPLYVLMENWFSKGPKSRILGGDGSFGIPYMHIGCLIRLLRILMDKTDDLPDYDIYIASPDGVTTHKELFELTTTLHSGNAIKPWLLPLPIVWLGVAVFDLFGRLIGNRPFERPWMVRYLGSQLRVDSKYTRKALDWAPKQRHRIERRLLYLVEHAKSFPLEWHTKNQASLKIENIDRPNLIIAEALMRRQNEIIERLLERVRSDKGQNDLPNYNLKSDETLRWYLGIYYNQLMTSVRTGDRMSLVNYSRFLANIRSRESFTAAEVANALNRIGEIVIAALLEQQELQDLELLVNDSIGLTIQLAVDEVEDSFDRIEETEKRKID